MSETITAPKRLVKPSAKSYAGLLKTGELKDKKAFVAPVYLEEQMLLPTMELYLATAASMQEHANKCRTKAPRRQKATATVCVWERLF